MLQSNPPTADAYVVGSDQIWNTTDGIYFLSWAKDNVIKASMAASFGARNSSEDFCKLISPWLKRFNLITVRENNGLEICKDAGRSDAVLVPDPTLLLNAEDYEKIIADNPPQKPYLFIYFLGTRTEINWKEIRSFAKSHNLDIAYVGSQGQEDKYPKQEPSIDNWLALMKNASYVITNSFHGTVFALLFKKKFMVYPVTGPASKMNGRLTTLLAPLNLTDRIYTHNLNKLTQEIEYENVSNALKTKADNANRILTQIFE